MKIIVVCFMLYGAFLLGRYTWKELNGRGSYESFELLEVSEQIEKLNELKDTLETAESLRTDMETLSGDCLLPITLCWHSFDGSDCEYLLYLDGTNTATESLRDIMEREASDLREDISLLSSLLKSGRRRLEK